jgi:plastocyanin
MPRGTKTGEVIDVPIRDRHVADPITVKPGDEIRWVNKRSAAVRVIVLDRLGDEHLSCKNHFGGLATPADTARLTTTDTASLCFRNPGTYRYVIRMEMDRQTPELNIPGVITVERQDDRTESQDTDHTPSTR